MGEQRAYQLLFTGLERRTRELTDYVAKEDAVARVAKSKSDKLLSDITELKRLGEAYVAKVNNEANIANIYNEQGALLDKVNQALEGASDRK